MPTSQNSHQARHSPYVWSATSPAIKGPYTRSEVDGSGPFISRILNRRRGKPSDTFLYPIWFGRRLDADGVGLLMTGRDDLANTVAVDGCASGLVVPQGSGVLERLGHAPG
jgi:hypothetical protein